MQLCNYAIINETINKLFILKRNHANDITIVIHTITTYTVYKIKDTTNPQQTKLVEITQYLGATVMVSNYYHIRGSLMLNQMAFRTKSQKSPNPR